MKGIVLISHGRFAEGIKESLEMLCGECPQVFTVCLAGSDSPDAFSKRFLRAYEEAEKYGEPLVFCDIMGGTPCNLALQQLMKKEDASLIAGMNLPMLMTAVLQDAEKALLLQEGREAITDVLEKAMLSSADCEVDED